MIAELVLWIAAGLVGLYVAASFRSASGAFLALLGAAGAARSALAPPGEPSAWLGAAIAGAACAVAALVWRQCASLRFERGRAEALRDELLASTAEATSTIEASNLRFTSLARMSPIGFFETNPEGTLVYVSQRWSEFVGVEPTAARGRPWTIVVRPEERADVEGRWREQDEFELEFRPAAERAAADWVLCKLQAQRTESGAVAGYVGAVTDVSERKAQEEDRRQLELRIQKVQKLESLGLLAAGVAHDLNNLLVGVVGNVDLLRSALEEGSRLHRYVDRIERAAARTAAMVRHMQVFSGRAPGDFEPVDLHALALDIARMMGASLPAELHVAPAGGALPAVKGDSAQLSQVLLNLITNAAESYPAEDGRVDISIGVHEADGGAFRSMLDSRRKSGEHVYLEVSDRGAGMAPGTAERVFDPFFSTKFEGRGLGLAVVHGIVRGHRGAILLDSAPGRGTRVRILFPVAAEPAPPTLQPEPLAARHPTPSAAGGWILVVDDEDEVLETTRSMLETAGYPVLTAGDGRLALEMFREYAAEVRTVLLDVTLPHISGETLVRELKSMRGDARIVLFSGFSHEEVVRRFSLDGIAGYLQKPFRRDELLQVLQETRAG